MLGHVAAAVAASRDSCGCQEVLMTIWILQAGGLVAVALLMYGAYRVIKKEIEEGGQR